MDKILIFLISALITLNSYSQSRQTDVSNIKNKYLDIPYATLSIAQKLDIYLPEKIDDALPVIVSVHGGAFMSGDKRDGQLKPMLEGLNRGYAVISINYRLSGESLFPANINDVKAAIRWIKANSKTYELNPNKIAVWGGSAGGNLVALAGTSGGVKELEDLSLGNESYSSEVHAVVDWFGPTDFLKMDEQLQQSGKGIPNHNEANSPESRLMGAKITLIPDEVQKANPETYITVDVPPFLIQHGTEDPLVPYQQSENFYFKLKKVLGEQKVTFDLLKGAGHGGSEFVAKENLDRIYDFLDRTLKKN